MSRTRLQLAKEILEAVMDEPTADRPAALARLCAGDESLREQLTLAMSRVDADTFLATPLVGPDAVPAQQAPPITRVGSYELIRLIGEGGMGAVYEARQENPRRSVALKVLRAGLFSADASRRFQHEAQMLGVLHHPCIAQVYEAGSASTPLGEVPYFAMELIRGAPLSSYVKERQLSTRDKLELLTAICDAVEHAHRHGIVHRDLKPANILIETADADDASRPGAEPGKARPKILDFGVARAVSGEMRDATMHTGAGQIVGTLSYMSPEQMSGDPDRVDERSDVYSLGVLAYEMLSGRLPIDVRGRSLPEITRSILHDEPTRLRSIDGRFSGDVDTIVSKAIEKDPSRRYQSAAALAADIRRYLRDEPIVARPATSLYQLRKFARRNRTIVAGVLATFVTLLAGAITTAYWAVRATERRALAEERAEQLQRKAYRASIAAAQAALERGQGDAARAHLADAPADLRGWEWNYVNAMLDRSDRTLHLPLLGYSVAVLDGPWALFADRETQVLTNWVDQTSVPIPDPAPLDSLYALSVSPRGDRFAVCGHNGAALYNAETGELIGVLPRAMRFETQAFSKDGSLFVGGAVQPQEMIVVDAATGAILRSFPLKGDRRVFPAVSPVEDVAVVSIDNDAVGVLDIHTGRLVHSFPGELPRFSADGRLIVVFVGLRTGQPRLDVRDAATGQLVDSLPLYDDFIPLLGGGARLAALSPDSTMFAVMGRNSVVTLYDVRTMRIIGALSGLPVRTGGTFMGLSFSPDGRWLAGFAGRDTLKVWDLVRSVVPLAQPHLSEIAVETAEISPDGRLCVTGDWGQITAWSTTSGAPVWSILPSFEFITALAFSADGSRLCVGGDKGAVWILDPVDGCIITSGAPHGVSTFGSNWVSSLDWAGAPDGPERLAAGFADGTIMILDPGALTPVRTFGRKMGMVKRIGVSPTGDAIAALLPEHLLILSGPAWTETVVPISEASSLAWSPDGNRLVVGRSGGLTMYARNGIIRAEMDGARAEQFCVAFSPDGSRVVGGSSEGGVTIWDALHADLLIDLPMARVDAPRAAAFTPDGASVLAVTSVTPVVRFETQKPSEADAQAREIARRALDAHQRAKAEARFARETIERLEREPGLPEDVRAEAIRRARILGDHAAIINNNAFVRARFPTDEATLRSVLRETEAVIERCQDGFGLLTRGMVLYRASRHEEAIEFFKRAEVELRTTRANWGEGPPELSGFWGLAEAALGNAAGAEAQFGVFDRVIREARYRDAPHASSLKAEVAAAREGLRVRQGK